MKCNDFMMMIPMGGDGWILVLIWRRMESAKPLNALYAIVTSFK